MARKHTRHHNRALLGDERQPLHSRSFKINELHWHLKDRELYLTVAADVAREKKALAAVGQPFDPDAYRIKVFRSGGLVEQYYAQEHHTT